MKYILSGFKALAFGSAAMFGSLSIASASEITNASQYVGLVRFQSGAGRVHTGSNFLIDEASFGTSRTHQCNFSGRVAIVTANHVLKNKKVGDRVSVVFPYHEFDELYQPQINPSIVVRDIVSDLAIANLSSSDKSLLRNLNVAARPKCTGLAGSDLARGTRVSIRGFETGSYLSTATEASLRSIIDKNSVDLRNSRVLAFDNEKWLTLDGYSSRGMSGGVAYDSAGVARAVILKKLPDSSPNAKPVTLAISMSKVRSELNTLWREGQAARTGKYTFAYIPATEEVEFIKDELRFRELTKRKTHQFKLQLAGDPHDIGGTYASATNLMDLSSAHSGLVRYLDTRGSAVIISRMTRGTRYFDDYQRYMNESSNYVLVVQAAQGKPVNSMVDLMRVMQSLQGHEKLRLTIALKSIDGRKGLMEIGDGPRESVSKLNLLVSSVLEKYGSTSSRKVGKEVEDLERVHGLAADLMNAVIDSEMDQARTEAIRSVILELEEMATDTSFGSRDHTHREDVIQVKRAIRKIQDHFQVFSQRSGQRQVPAREQELSEDPW